MNNFFYDGEFYSELAELVEDLYDANIELVKALPNDFFLDCRGASLEPLFTLDEHFIVQQIDSDRFGEGSEESEAKQIIDVLKKHIDFAKINSELPKLWYEQSQRIVITKAQLLKCAQEDFE